jgi:hypothetical protein
MKDAQTNRKVPALRAILQLMARNFNFECMHPETFWIALRTIDHDIIGAFLEKIVDRLRFGIENKSCHESQTQLFDSVRINGFYHITELLEVHCPKGYQHYVPNPNLDGHFWNTFCSKLKNMERHSLPALFNSNAKRDLLIELTCWKPINPDIDLVAQVDAAAMDVVPNNNATASEIGTIALVETNTMVSTSKKRSSNGSKEVSKKPRSH